MTTERERELEALLAEMLPLLDASEDTIGAMDRLLTPGQREALQRDLDRLARLRRDAPIVHARMLHEEAERQDRGSAVPVPEPSVGRSRGDDLDGDPFVSREGL